MWIACGSKFKWMWNWPMDDGSVCLDAPTQRCTSVNRQVTNKPNFQNKSNVTMDIRHYWRDPLSAKICCTLILLTVQIIHESSGHGHSANSKVHFSNNMEAPLRRDIASVSVTEVNRSRNLRQAYDDNAYKYTEILPVHPHHHFSNDFENNMERNSSDNRKPAFYACKDYAPKVKEEQPWNTFVIKVDAEDPDEYDTITYSFEKSANERAKFRINEKTGEIVTSYTFDRDEPIREKEVSNRSVQSPRSTNCTLFIENKESSICFTWHKRCAICTVPFVYTFGFS